MKALFLMAVTLLGISTDESLEHPLKTFSSMLVSPFPISTEVRLEQPLYLQLIVYQFVLIKTVDK